MKNYRITLNGDTVMRFKMDCYLRAKEVLRTWYENLVEAKAISQTDEVKLWADDEIKYVMYEVGQNTVCQHGDYKEWKRVWVITKQNGEFAKYIVDDENANKVFIGMKLRKGCAHRGVKVVYLDGASDVCYGEHLYNILLNLYGYKVERVCNGR